MSPCRFCEIINEPKKANEEVVFENEHFIVLLDKYRQTSIGGICLIVPKKHRANLFELDEYEASEIINLISFIGKKMQEAYSARGIRVWTAINKEAGQSIFHCHIHLVPCNRFMDRLTAMIPGIYDILRRIFKLNKSALNSERLFEYAEKIRIQINTN
jgi:histidine triad (HIT) family protein